MTVQPVDYFSKIPEEASFHILSFLNGHDLALSCRVSKTWRRLAGDDRLWKGVLPEVPTPETGVKAFVDGNSFRTFEEIVKQCQAFADTLPLNLDGDFCCVFPYNPTFSLTAQIKYRTAPFNGKRHICFFMRMFPDVRPLESSINVGGFYSAVKAKALLPSEIERLDLCETLCNIFLRKRGEIVRRPSTMRRNVLLISGAVVVAAVFFGYFFKPFN